MMRDRTAVKELFSSLLRAAAYFCLCVCIQHSSTLLAKLTGSNAPFTRLNDFEWAANIAPLPTGSYYLSVGRPRAPCDVFLNNTLISSTKSQIPEIRNNLLLGASFTIKNPGATTLTLLCEQQGGFKGDLTHEPIVAKHAFGVTIQLLRGATELLIGPISSCLLLLLVFSQISFSTSHQGVLVTAAPKSQFGNFPHLFFAIVALLYSCSLAYYSRLYVSGMQASILHVFLRNVFSTATIILFGYYGGYRKFLIFTQTLLAFITLGIGQFAPQVFTVFYKFEYLLFPLFSLICTFDLFKAEAKTKSLVIMRSICITWTAVQLMDTSSIYTGYGSYMAPSVVALLTTTAALLRIMEKYRSDRIETTAARILAIIESKSPVREIIAQVSTIASGETTFSRASAYIDGFCIGYADHPNAQFVRVMESGYQKDTSKDSQIDFQDGRGSIMALATQTGEIVFRKGDRDNAWFIVAPLGKHAVLNLSNDRPTSLYAAHESEEVVRRLLPALQTLNTRLIDHSLRQGFALEQLRSIHGDGRFDREIGSTFVDINDYSLFSERYGAPFSDFISAVYFPALIKATSKWAAPEFVRGDEIYFVSIKELIAEACSIRDATLSTISSIQSFVRNEGARLCTQHGYQPLSTSIGGAVGDASIICDPIKVRTAGPSVNEAKRLQESAGRGEALIKSSVIDTQILASYVFGEEAPVLVKKNLILARRLLGVKRSHAA